MPKARSAPPPQYFLRLTLGAFIMTRGYIYFLSNTSMPGLIKIGQTTQDIEARIRQLNSTGVPSPFVLAACVSVANPSRVEAELHTLLKNYRHTDNREFFEGSVADLLQKSMPLLIKATDISAVPSHDLKKNRAHDLEPKTIELLVCLTGDQRNYGYAEYELTGWFKEEPALKIEARLAHLKQLGLTAEKRSREDWKGSVWRITSEGKKFLFDYGYITDEMLNHKYF